MTESLKTVQVDELRPGMRLHEVVRLDSKYRTIDSRTLASLQAQLAEATFVVAGDAGKREVGADQLKVFDEITAIRALPASWAHANVAADTVAALRELGFYGFVVADHSVPDTPPARKRLPDQATPETVAEVKAFFDKVAVAQDRRANASIAVEDMLERGRRGKYSTDVAEAAVDDIIRSGASTAIQAIAGLKSSDQTYAHCVDTSVIFQETYADMLQRTGQQAPPAVNRITLISGFMHDIGKSKVPKDILESTARFEPDSKEMMLMRQHASEGAKILSDLGMTKETINVAHYHHVKVDNSLNNSYPAVDYGEVMPITRLAAIVDVYQALIGKRSYKRNWVPGKAVGLLMKLRGKEFDERMLGHFLHSVGIYPIGSLLRLSTGDLAFVVSIDPQALERPVVVVVESAAGERLTHHHVIDLRQAQDVSVAEVVDHFEYYNASEDEAFEIFSRINLA